MELPGFFRLAKIESRKGQLRVKVGAVISRGGSVIATGYNQDKTHPLTNTFSLHAEAAAIISRRHYDSHLNGATIWVYRERSSGKPGLSKPCRDCMRLIVGAGIKRIYFTTYNPPYYTHIDL